MSISGMLSDGGIARFFAWSRPRELICSQQRYTGYAAGVIGTRGACQRARRQTGSVPAFSPEVSLPHNGQALKQQHEVRHGRPASTSRRVLDAVITAAINFTAVQRRMEECSMECSAPQQDGGREDGPACGCHACRAVRRGRRGAALGESGCIIFKTRYPVYCCGI